MAFLDVVYKERGDRLPRLGHLKKRLERAKQLKLKLLLVDACES